MGSANDETKNVLFAYVEDNSGHFWVYDGSLYHRFLWREEGLYYIRSQAYLPKYSFGKSLTMNDAQRRLLESVAARHDVSLLFFDSVVDCNRFNLLLPQDQFIFDFTFPGGYFLIE